MKDNLTEDIKNKIISALNLQGVSAADISDTTPLFGDDGLGLDSVDALELVVMLEREYSINVSEQSIAKEIFSTPASIAEYVRKNSK